MHAAAFLLRARKKKKKNHLSFIYLYSEGGEGVTGRKAENNNAALGDLNRNGGLLMSEENQYIDCAFIASAVRVCVCE